MALEGASQTSQPALVPVSKPLSLIPVVLKEAALDSPTFRSTAVHFADQIDAIEKWLEGYVKFAGKLAQEVLSLEGVVNSFLQHSTPPEQLSEAVLDHDYTLLAMRRYGDGAREFWSHTLTGMKQTQESIVDPIRDFLQHEVRPFKDVRRTLEQTQKSFDGMMSRYLGQSKTKESSGLREDAFQLHESRKAYLKASMDFCTSAPYVRRSLDTLIIKVFADQWFHMKGARETSTTTFEIHQGEMERVCSWSFEMAQGEKTLRRELLLARKQIEDSAETATRPSRELDDYAASTVPYIGNGPTATQKKATKDAPASRQGWLFLRTVTGKPSRTTWIRRWFFVKNGIFGWLVQGARSGGVEESEKIGVLLCNVRPAFQEERRFCFEVKTKDTTILLQAETQSDLMEWLGVFDIAKQKALDEPSTTELLSTSGNPAADAAFAVSPALAPELAARRPDGQVASITEESVSTLNIPDSEAGGDKGIRASFDVGTLRRNTGEDRPRDHASKIIQKLDLHRKSTPTQALSAGHAASAAPATGSGVASLISSTHSFLPLTPTRSDTGRTLPGRGITDAAVQSLAPPTLVMPPAPTNLSKMAVIVGLERNLDLGGIDNTGGTPSSLMANQWGTANYGFMTRMERGEIRDRSLQTQPPALVESPVIRRNSDTPSNASRPSTANRSPSPAGAHRRTTSDNEGGQSNTTAAARGRRPVGSKEYPPYYPQLLKAHDAQFRMLFSNVPQDDEDRVVLVFRASWCPSDNQDLPGRVYVTMSGLYFYSHHLGFTLVSGRSLAGIREVSATVGPQHDFLYMRLQVAEGRDESATVSLKTFIEPVKLLQRRLHFLVANYNSDESMDLENVLRSLANMEDFQRARVPTYGTLPDASASEQNLQLQRTRSDTATRVRVDRNMYNTNDTLGYPNEADILRFKLPGKPVVYTPRGMPSAAVEREFDISAKALFHMMFGDKSVLAQMLYHARHIDTVTQHPWTKLEPAADSNNSTTTHAHDGIWARQFEYAIATAERLRRPRSVVVFDRQTIDVANEHLCYVVSDVKTPWHLPYNRDFILLTKVVVTHVAKSRCKLAMFVAVVWARDPLFSKQLIERHALNHLTTGANDLVDLVADQVEKLGPDGRTTRRVIEIFGAVGVQKEAIAVKPREGAQNVLPARPLRTRVKYRDMSSLYFEATVSFLATSTSAVVMAILAAARGVFREISVHRVLALVLLVSLGMQMLAGTQTAKVWYRDRQTANYMARLGVRADATMHRAISLTDLYDATNPSHYAQYTPAAQAESQAQGYNASQQAHNSNQCFNAFSSLVQSTSSSLSHVGDFSIDSGRSSSPLASSATVRRLQRTRRRMAGYRHDLTVALRMVNRIERETLAVEYEEWVRAESRRCVKAKHLLDVQDASGQSVQAEKEKARGKDKSKSSGGKDSEAERRKSEEEEFRKRLGLEQSDMVSVREWFTEYCSSCIAEADRVVNLV